MSKRGSLVETSSRLIDEGGDYSPAQFAVAPEPEVIAEGVYFIQIFSNIVVFETDSSLVLVDTGPYGAAFRVEANIRSISDKPVGHAIFTHGHIDHVFGLEPFDSGQSSPPIVIAHENVPARFDRYKLTAGYNEAINRRQFSSSGLMWPKEFRYPDVTYRSEHAFEVDGVEFVAFHAKGETDDHTVVWIPEHKVLCTGDLVIWCSPNAGNPQKVQRYPLEWAKALRKMAAFDAEFLLPGHGLPVAGRERICTLLLDTALLLETIHDQVVYLMNEGRTLDEIVEKVEYPRELLAKPYLRPVYDDPEFIVRNIWRLYGGWYDGNPAHLKPPRFSKLAQEIAALAGGPEALAQRALEAMRREDLRVAAALVEMAAAAGPTDTVLEARASIYTVFAESETSLMAKGIFRDAAVNSRRRANR